MHVRQFKFVSCDLHDGHTGACHFKISHNNKYTSGTALQRRIYNRKAQPMITADAQCEQDIEIRKESCGAT